MSRKEAAKAVLTAVRREERRGVPTRLRWRDELTLQQPVRARQRVASCQLEST